MRNLGNGGCGEDEGVIFGVELCGKSKPVFEGDALNNKKMYSLTYLNFSLKTYLDNDGDAIFRPDGTGDLIGEGDFCGNGAMNPRGANSPKMTKLVVEKNIKNKT